MEFWPIYVLLCCSFLIFGRGQEDYLGYVPTLAAIVAGVVLMRYTNLATGELNFLFGPIDRVALFSAAVWLCVTLLTAFHSKYLVAFLLGISTIAYLPWMLVNIAITRLGIAAIASDIPLVLAIMACGNGIFGNPIGSWINGLRYFLPTSVTGEDMAKSQARIAEDHRGDRG